MVELRSRTHLHSQLHSIRAIKDGSVKLVVNVVARGKSKLRFRQLTDIYNLENTEDDVPIPRAVRDLENDSEMAQGSCTFGAEVSTKTDPEDFDMTLGKIRKQCRKKKRKLINREGDSETASEVKVEQEYSSLLTEDEGCDVEEPVSSWNTKLSMIKKKKQGRKTKCDSTFSQSAKKVDLPMFFDVKPEASWDDSYSVLKAIDFIPTDSLLDSSKEPESTSNTELLVEESMYDLPKDTRLVVYRSPESNSPGMVDIEEPITTMQVDEAFNVAAEELIDAMKAQCCIVDNLALENVLCGSVSREEDELEVPLSSDSEAIGCVENLSGSEEVEEDEQSNGSKPNLDMNITGLEIVKTDAPEIRAGLDMTTTCLETVKVDAPEMLATDISGSFTVDYGVENTVFVWENKDIANGELPEATDILQLTGDSMDNLHSVPDDSTISLEEDHLPERLHQSSFSGSVDEAGDHKSSRLFQAPSDEVKTAEESDSVQQQELHYQPEKLLSGRKALSPTSQAKLRKAMEHPESPEKRCKKSKGKLYFSSQNSHRILKAQGLDSIDRVEVVPNPKHVTRKANNNTRQTQYQRATNKFSRRDTLAAKPQPFSTGRTSLQGCTQKAIDFSQGQMRDFQYVASKLTKELKSMRQITKRCLLAESNPSIMSECNLDEVKTLIGNAEKTEESSKKWLSMIERDCNRFCKLMGMVSEDSPVSENIVQKKKKIKFADDAGGDLCHVKVFEIDLESG